MKISRNFLQGIVCIYIISIAFTANAITITDTGQVSGGNPGNQPILKATITNADIGASFDMNWLHDTGSGIFSAESTWTITSLTDTELILGISIENTTPVLSPAGIASLGFGVDPNATGVAFNGGTGTFLDLVELDPQPPFPGFQTFVDICVFAGNNCAGGPQGNLLPKGGSDSFSLKIDGAFSDNLGGQMVMLDSFALKTQTDAGSFELAGSVPIPSTLLFFGAGFAAFVGWRRYEERKSVN